MTDFGSGSEAPRHRRNRRASPLGQELRALAAAPPPPDEQPPATTANQGRGRLLFVGDIQHDVLRDSQTPNWILQNFAPESKKKVGRKVCWWERDALQWLDSQTDRRG